MRQGSAPGVALDVLAAPNRLEIARIGLIVPKKVIPTAVARNRIKRLLREWFRARQDELLGVDIVARIKCKARVCNTDENALKDDFLSGLAACKACLNSRKPVANNTD